MLFSLMSLAQTVCAEGIANQAQLGSTASLNKLGIYERAGCPWWLEQWKWSEILQYTIRDSMLKNYWGTHALNSAVRKKFENKGGARHPWITNS